MRFASDDRAPAGPDLRRPGRHRQARRGATASRRSSAPTTTQSFPGPAGKPTTDAWTVLAGLARETDRIGLGVLVSPVTFRHPGNFAKVVTTVDEMSGGRIEVGVGAGWNDARASPARPALPADQRRGRPAGGPARDPARPVGRAGRLVVRGPRRSDLEDALFRPKPVDVPGRRGRRSAARGRGSSPAARVRRGRTGSRRATRTSSTCSSTAPARRRGGLREARRGVPGDRARPGDAGPLDDGGRAHRPGRRRGPGPRGGGARGLRRRTRTATTWLEERRERWVFGTPDEARAMVRRFADGGRRSGSCSRTSCPGTST